MIDVKHKRCLHDGCDSQPVFDIPEGKGRYCSIHKISGMIDVKNKRCIHDGCDSQPVFDIPGGKGRYCSIHKISGMIDVKHKRCLHDGCEISVSYGKPGLAKSHCYSHRESGMIRRPNAKCANCNDLAVWGTNWTPKHCEIHKTHDEENLVEKPCSSCGLMYVLDRNNHCENCNPESFATTRLAKQNALMNYLDARGLKGCSTDTAIENSACGRERPDRVYDFGNKIIVLECDENQHRDRQCLCEQTRMVNIGQSFGGMPVYFIRWNPDDYSPENDRRFPEELSKRHKLVGDLIRDIQNGKYCLSENALVSAIYLYYDGWNSLHEQQWEVITKIE